MAMMAIWYRGFSDDEAMQKAIDQLSSDSDRAVAIVGAAMIDDRLEQAIRTRTTQGDKTLKHLFSTSGALGSLAAKAEMAYVLGLLDSEAKNDIEQLLHIRNRFAHELNISEFNNKIISEFCAKLKLAEHYIHEREEGKPSATIVMNRYDGKFASFKPNVSPLPCPIFRIPKARETLQRPRERFVYTLQVLIYWLGLHIGH